MPGITTRRAPRSRLGAAARHLAPKPGDQAERREQLAALPEGDREDLTPRQREVFVAIALNDVPIDVLALQLDSNRNAIYKNLFDARRKLRAQPGRRRTPARRRGGARVSDLDGLDELLRAQEGDAGCDAGVPIMDQYVEIELRGEDPSERFPGTAIHLRVCPGCRADHDGVLEAARRFGDLDPE